MKKKKIKIIKIKESKPKAGFFGVAGCAGCLLTVIYEDLFLKLNELLDVKAFPLIKEEEYKGEFDIVFIEGTVTFDEDIVVLNELRKRSRVVVALGTCACAGGVPSIKNFRNNEKVMKFVYPKYNHLKMTNPTPIHSHIKVDYFLPQCPPDKEEILEFVKCFLAGKQFRNNQDPVCIECRKRGNLCLLQEGELCLGPVTRAGCKAICPTNGVSCYGCRGPSPDANYESFIELLHQKGYRNKEILEKLRTFAGLDFEEKIKEKGSTWLEK